MKFQEPKMVCVVEGVEELNGTDGAADEYEQHDGEEDGKEARWQGGKVACRM